MRGSPCAFCGAARPLAETGVLDEKWSRRFGGTAAVALDHGWYASATGERTPADALGSAKFFSPVIRACCDQCITGWMEDLRWRAEPTLLALAERRELAAPPVADLGSVVRWAQLTAMLDELAPGMPTASSSDQRQAVRSGVAAAPATSTWLFTLRQRLPARVHLSQVDGPGGLVQVVSLDVAHFSALVVIPTDEASRHLTTHSALDVELGAPREAGGPGDERRVRELDLARTPHPHRIAVHRLCSNRAAH